MKIIKILLALIIAFALFSCDAFIAQQKERENPYDAANPVPAVVNFKATPINENNDVRLSWNKQETRELPPNMIIVGKPGSEPTSIDDYIIRLENDTFNVGDFSCEAQGVDTNYGKEWYFSAWACDGSREQFTFCGTDSATFELVQVELVAGVDGFVRSDVFSDFGGDDLKTGWDAIHYYVSLLKFRQEDILDFVTGAELALTTTMTAGPNDTIGILKILVGWDEGSIDYSTATGAGFADIINVSSESVIAADTIYYWDVKDFIAGWAESPESNYGLLISNTTGAGCVDFCSTEISTELCPILFLEGYK